MLILGRFRRKRMAITDRRYGMTKL